MPTKSKPIAKKSRGGKHYAKAAATVRQTPREHLLTTNSRGGWMLKVRGRLAMSRDAFAPLVAASPRKLAAIEGGEAPGEALRRGLTQLDRVVDALSEVVDESAIGQWMATPNQAFGGLKPFEIIQRGEIDRLWQMIYLLRSGAPS